jgi:hypothetical protein
MFYDHGYIPLVANKIESLKLVENDIHWVLTVPAIWKDNAKQFMREAAQQVFFYLPH